jgi:hypothetical protein
MPGCLPCSTSCPAGDYVQGSCSGEQAENKMLCAKCTVASAASGGLQCPAARTLPVKRGQYTVVNMASEFWEDCVLRKGLDCMRRQALMYLFDGHCQEEDLAPWNSRLQRVSASTRSDGPSMQVLMNLPRTDIESDPMLQLLMGEHRRTTASLFNASNHEYYAVPMMANVFDPTLAVRIIPNTRVQDASKIPTSVIWEHGMTLCLWYKFASMTGSWQTLFEMSNGYGTEHVYVQRRADSSDILLGVSHTSGSFRKEFSTSSGAAINTKGLWQHLCWSIQHILPQNVSQLSNQSGTLTLLPESLFWSSLPTSYSTSMSYVAAQAMGSYQVRWIMISRSYQC